MQPTSRLIAALRMKVPAAKVIGFPRGIGSGILRYAMDLGLDAVGLDWTADLDLVREQVQPRLPVQGNLDPLVLVAGGTALDHAVGTILDKLSQGPFIFNLGHQKYTTDADPTRGTDARAHTRLMMRQHVRLDKGVPHHCGHFLDGGHALPAPALFLSLRGAARLTQSECFKVMERRLRKAIINPAMIATWLLGFSWLGAGEGRLVGSRLAGTRSWCLSCS